MVCAMSMRRTALVLWVILGGCGGGGPGKSTGSTGGEEGGDGGSGGGSATGGKSGTGGAKGTGGGVGTGGAMSTGGAVGTGGATGTGGAMTGTGGAMAGPDGGCPPPAMAGAPRRAFPQRAGYPGCADCIHPNVPQATMDADVKAAYDSWKKLLKTIPSGDVANEYVVGAGAAGNISGWPAGVGPNTQSEGHGYGMMILALMAGYDPMAKMYFDSMNRVRKAFPSRED